MRFDGKELLQKLENLLNRTQIKSDTFRWFLGKHINRFVIQKIFALVHLISNILRVRCSNIGMSRRNECLRGDHSVIRAD